MNTLKRGWLTVATYYGFAPVCAEKDGVAWGTDISFVKEFAADHGLRVDFIPVDFKDIWLRPGNNECDMAAAGITPVAKRVAEAVGAVWSDEYFHVRRSLLVRGADGWRSIDDFAGKTIVVTRDSTADLDLQARPAKGATVKRYSNDQQKAVDELKAGVIDAFGEGDVSNIYLARQNPGLAVIDVHDMAASEPGAREIFSFPVREESGIIGALNTWLAGKSEEDYKDIPELKMA
jgi:ABC-type amino acid transport substrate-binding protein